MLHQWTQGVTDRHDACPRDDRVVDADDTLRIEIGNVQDAPQPGKFAKGFCRDAVSGVMEPNQREADDGIAGSGSRTRAAMSTIDQPSAQITPAVTGTTRNVKSLRTYPCRDRFAKANI